MEIAGEDPDPVALSNASSRTAHLLSIIRDVDGSNKVTADERRLDAAQEYFDGLQSDPKEQSRIILKSPLVKIWFHINVARYHWNEYGDWGLYNYWVAEFEEVQKNISSNPGLKQIIDTCHARLKEFDATRYSPVDVEWFRELSDQDRRQFAKVNDATHAWVANLPPLSETADPLGPVREALEANTLLVAYARLREVVEDVSDPALPDRLGYVLFRGIEKAAAWLSSWDDISAEQRKARYARLKQADQEALRRLRPEDLEGR